MDRLKEYWKNLTDRTRRIIIGAGIGALIFIVAGVIWLNFGRTVNYSTLFTGLNQSEAQQIASLLQDSGVDYRYDASSGVIRVPEDKAEAARVSLLSQGYPKSGFAYDMYISNSGLMATESDKKQYTLYDLQDRLGATIRLFDGVQDAKVTIAQGSTSVYALDDSDDVEATASAVVTMQSGKALSASNAQAIKNLIARSVQGMTFTNVSVFDAATMNEIAGTAGDLGGSSDLNDLTAQLENQIASNVKRVLAKLYGIENVEVSVKGTIDSAHVLQENIQYNVPEKINENDKLGLIRSEETQNAGADTGVSGTGGVAGTDANADVPRYTTQVGENTTGSSYTSGSASRDYLYDSRTEQRETQPGVLTDVTVAAVISTNDTSIPEANLISLIADAAGVSRTDAADKITIIRSPQAVQETVETTEIPLPADWTDQLPLPLPLLIALIAGIILIILILLLVMRSRRKKRQAQEEMQIAELRAAAAEQETEPMIEEEVKRTVEMEMTPEAERAAELKDNIGNFVEQNPQVAAKLVQSWLRDEEDDSGRKRRRGNG